MVSGLLHCRVRRRITCEQIGSDSSAMNRNLQDAERGPWDFIMFGLTFYGFVFTLGGVIVASTGVAVTGLMAMCLGLLYFGLQHWLLD